MCRLAITGVRTDLSFWTLLTLQVQNKLWFSLDEGGLQVRCGRATFHFRRNIVGLKCAALREQSL